MDFNYLKFLAKIGQTNIHPYEGMATDLLIQELKLRDGQRVLELGCGTGGTIVRICGRHGVNVFGLDLLDEMLATAVKRIKLTNLANNVCLVKGNITALPFDNATFDRVYGESVVGILDRETVITTLEEVYRVINDGGIFVLNDAMWKQTTTAEQAHTINQACIRDFGLPLASTAVWHVDDWVGLFQAHGFRAKTILIADAIQSVDGLVKKRQELISQLFSTAYKIMGHLNPGLRRQKKTYNDMLEKHRDDGRFIEPRLFILTKIDPLTIPSPP